MAQFIDAGKFIKLYDYLYLISIYFLKKDQTLYIIYVEITEAICSEDEDYRYDTDQDYEYDTIKNSKKTNVLPGVFNVDVILDHRGLFTNRQPYIQKLEFLTKWEECGTESWEPYKNIKKTIPFETYVNETFKG